MCRKCIRAVQAFHASFLGAKEFGATFERFMVANGDAANLCTEHDADGAPTARGMARAEAFVARARNWTPFAWWLYEQFNNFRTGLNWAWCELVGHDLVDESYGGPDSGCMAARCARCGWSFHEPLY